MPWSLISSELRHDQRLFISILQKEPYVYIVTKIKNTSPKGIVTVTVKQDKYNYDTDYVNMETGEMYADYYKGVEPSREENPDPTVPDIPIVNNNVQIELNYKYPTLKIGGSYKGITVSCIQDEINEEDNGDETHNIIDVTDNYTFTWDFSMNEQDVEDMIIMQENGDVGQSIKIKLNDNYKGIDVDGNDVYIEEYIGQEIVATCSAHKKLATEGTGLDGGVDDEIDGGYTLLAATATFSILAL